MYLQKGLSIKTYVEKNLFFVALLKVTGEQSKILILIRIWICIRIRYQAVSIRDPY